MYLKLLLFLSLAVLSIQGIQISSLVGMSTLFPLIISKAKAHPKTRAGHPRKAPIQRARALGAKYHHGKNHHGGHPLKKKGMWTYSLLKIIYIIMTCPIGSRPGKAKLKRNLDFGKPNGNFVRQVTVSHRGDYCKVLDHGRYVRVVYILWCI